MYIVIELQTTGDSVAIVTPVTYSDPKEAESKYHAVLSAAAVSSVEKHACVILTEEGFLVDSKCYVHEEQA